MQIGQENYLLPISPAFTTQEEVANKGTQASDILRRMSEKRPSVSVLILDACRDNPLPKSRTTKILRGLAPIAVESGSNTLIIYATSPGSLAADGDGRNGIFTEALLRHMGADIPLSTLLTDVTSDVLAKTNNKQRPWVVGSTGEHFKFTPGDEPLRVKQVEDGEYVVTERRTERSYEFQSEGSVTEVRAHALSVYGDASKRAKWQAHLSRRLEDLDAAIDLLGELDDKIEEVKRGVNCDLDLALLTQGRVEAEAYRASRNIDSMRERTIRARDQELSDDCRLGFPWKNATLITLATAAVGTAIVGTVFITQADSKWTDAQRSCPEGMCIGEHNPGPEQSRDAKSAADTATVYYALTGVALAGTAAVYFLWPDRDRETVSQAPPVNLQVSRASALITARLSF
jgi:hypothetical protein